MLDALLTVATFIVTFFPYPFIGFVFALPAIFAIVKQRKLSFNRILLIGLIASTFAFIASTLITSRIYNGFLFPSVPSMEAYPYRDKIEDIQHEAWLRSVIPPPLQKDCFSSDYEVCQAFEDGSMMNKEFERSWGFYIQDHLEDTISFVVCIIIVGVASFFIIRRKSTI